MDKGLAETRDELWVNVKFTGDSLREFAQVQAHLGISTRTEVVRHLVHQMATRLRRDARAQGEPE